MPLTTYEDARRWAEAIRHQVLTRRMPIWHAARGYGAFANDPQLTPAEQAVIAAWVDGGQARGPASAGLAAAGGAMSLRRRPHVAVMVRAAQSDARVPIEARWIAAWEFEPGDPLITSATLTAADGAVIGTWVAGDAPVVLPASTAVRITSPIRIVIGRRARAEGEKPAAARRSVLRVVRLAKPPARRAWVERASCGTPRTSRRAELLAVRPLLAEGASARIWLERPGAPRVIVGWFRDADARFLRTYWLSRPADFPPESRIQSDTACTLDLTLASR
jgi:hypothetical protein